MTENAFRTARLLKILGNPLRYKIIAALRGGPLCSSEIAVHARRPLHAVSRALTHLGLAGLVCYRTAGRSVVYSLKHDDIRSVLDRVESFVRAHELPAGSGMGCGRPAGNDQ